LIKGTEVVESNERRSTQLQTEARAASIVEYDGQVYLSTGSEGLKHVTIVPGSDLTDNLRELGTPSTYLKGASGVHEEGKAELDGRAVMHLVGTLGEHAVPGVGQGHGGAYQIRNPRLELFVTPAEGQLLRLVTRVEILLDLSKLGNGGSSLGGQITTVNESTWHFRDYGVPVRVERPNVTDQASEADLRSVLRG